MHGAEFCFVTAGDFLAVPHELHVVTLRTISEIHSAVSIDVCMYIFIVYVTVALTEVNSQVIVYTMEIT